MIELTKPKTLRLLRFWSNDQYKWKLRDTLNPKSVATKVQIVNLVFIVERVVNADESIFGCGDLAGTRKIKSPSTPHTNLTG